VKPCSLLGGKYSCGHNHSKHIQIKTRRHLPQKYNLVLLKRQYPSTRLQGEQNQNVADQSVALLRYVLNALGCSFQLQAGRFWDRIPVAARFCLTVQTGPGAHSAYCTMGTGSLSWR